MTLQQFLKDYGVLCVFLGQIGWAALAWWRGKEIPTRSELAKLGNAIGAVRAHVETVEREFKHRCDGIDERAKGAPSKSDINNLRLEMEKVRGDIRVFTERAEGTKGTFDAQISTVETQVTSATKLVERVERMVDTLTQHLLHTGR